MAVGVAASAVTIVVAIVVIRRVTCMGLLIVHYGATRVWHEGLHVVREHRHDALVSNGDLLAGNLFEAMGWMRTLAIIVAMLAIAFAATRIEAARRHASPGRLRSSA